MSYAVRKSLPVSIHTSNGVVSMPECLPWPLGMPCAACQERDNYFQAMTINESGLSVPAWARDILAKYEDAALPTCQNVYWHDGDDVPQHTHNDACDAGFDSSCKACVQEYQDSEKELSAYWKDKDDPLASITDDTIYGFDGKTLHEG